MKARTGQIETIGVQSKAESDSVAPGLIRGIDTTGPAGASDVSIPDQQFLRTMSDHDEALLTMADDAAHAKGTTVQEEAEQLHGKGDKELHLMLKKLRSHFMDSY